MMMPSPRVFTTLLAGSALLMGAGTASAALTLFSNKALFLAQTGATAATTIPSTPDTTTTGFTSGSLSFALAAGSTNFIIDEWTTRLTGQDLAISGFESFDVTVNSGLVHSFGFDFVEPEFDPNVNGPFVESTFEVTLKNGASTVGSFQFSRANDSAEFVGVWSGTGQAFDRVQVREIVGNNENEFFGQFYTGTAAPVPEPMTAGLIAAAALAAAKRSMRRRSATP